MQRRIGVRGVRLVATTTGTRRARRPRDVVALITSLAVTAWLALRYDDPDALLNGLGTVAAALPSQVTTVLGFLPPLASLLTTILVIGLGAIGWRRHGLARDVLLAAGGSWAAALLIGWMVTGAVPPPDTWTWRAGDQSFPALYLVIVVGVVRTTGPHLARPVRMLASLLIGGAALATIAAEPGAVVGVIAAYAIGAAVAAAIHLIFGSPGGQPDEARYRSALEDLGIGVASLQIEPTEQWGAVIAHLDTDDGRRLTAKLYGRDAHDAQFLVKAWQFLWYQSSGPTLTVTRLQQVEHEAFLTLLATTRDVPTASFVASGVDAHGNALLVLDEAGVSFDALDPDALDDDLLDEVWRHAVALGEAGIIHGSLHSANLALVGLDGSGPRAQVRDLAGARLEPVGSDDALEDRAELLASLASLVGDERAVASARRVLGDDGGAALLPYLQPAALSRHTRRSLERSGPRLRAIARSRRLSGAGEHVAALRRTLAEELGVDPPTPEKLVRISWGNLVMAVFLLVAVFAVWSQLSGIGLDTVTDAMRGAAWGWAAVSFAVAVTEPVWLAIALMGTAARKLPLGPTVAQQYATQFINLAVPSSAGRIALNIRYFERFGIPATTAVAQGALAGFGGFLVQAAVTILALTVGGVDLSLPEGTDVSLGSDTATFEWLLVIGGVVVVVAVVAALRSGRIREVVVPRLQEGVGALRVLRNPRNVAMIIGGNAAAQIALALSLGAAVWAMGYEVGFWQLLLINTAIAMLAGILPIPGGMGVAEAGITAGLTWAGMPQAEAVGAMILFRLFTFYLPPIWGYVAMVWLRRHEYL